MKSAILNIPIKLKFEHIQADGSPCRNCGDRILLRQHDVFVVVGNAAPKPLSVSLCGSCADAAQSE